MKKSLLALAVAAAIPAVAQAQSNVTLYGIADAGLEWSNGAANSAAASSAAGTPAINGVSGFKVGSGLWTSSRLGVRGTEPLGNSGMAAIFNIEHRFQVDTGAIQVGQSAAGAPYTSLQAGSFWNGTAWVGLRSGMGEITLGRQYTPAFYAMYFPDWTLNAGYNNWAAPTVPSTTGTASAGAQGTSALYGLVRADNSLMWTSPTIGGLTVRVMQAYGALAYNSAEYTNVAQNPRSNGSGDLTAVSGVWRMGNLLVTGSYSMFDTANSIKDSWTVAGGYDFKAFGLSAAYTKLNFNRASATRGAYDISSWLLSAYLKVGANGKVYANVANIDVSDLGDGLQIGLTYMHDLSNRTAIYAGYGRNDFSGYGSGAGFESGKNKVALGVIHKF